MPRRTPLSKLDMTAIAYATLSTAQRPVSQELVRLNQPSITLELKALSDALLKQTTIMRETVDANGKPVRVEESIFPYDFGTNLHESWPQLLKFSDIPDAKHIMALYDSMSPEQSALLPLEAFCYATGTSSSRVIEILTGTLARMGMQANAILSAIWHPRVVEKTIKMALTDGGVSDRAFMHKATGFLPTPKGSQTTINVQQNAQRVPTVQFVPAPPPEATIRALADTFNEAKGLPATIVALPSIDVGVDDALEDEDETL